MKWVFGLLILAMYPQMALAQSSEDIELKQACYRHRVPRAGQPGMVAPSTALWESGWEKCDAFLKSMEASAFDKRRAQDEEIKSRLPK